MPHHPDLPAPTLREPPAPPLERLFLAAGILAVTLALLWILFD